jgi:peptidoglycan hydrolase-like protein with peptidoglycan-binding domain
MRIGDEERATARIRAVQAARGLAVTGRLDQPTWEAIKQMKLGKR